MAYSDFPRTQWAVDFDRIFRRHRRSTTINFCLTSVSGFETRSPKFRLVRTVVGYGLRPTDWAASLRESHLANIGATIKLIVSTKCRYQLLTQNAPSFGYNVHLAAKFLLLHCVILGVRIHRLCQTLSIRRPASRSVWHRAASAAEKEPVGSANKKGRHIWKSVKF